MSSAVHRVRRIDWKVRAPSEATALAVRARLRAVVDGELRAALAAVLDERDVGDDVLHIPRLDVRAVVDPDQLEDRVTAAVVAQLRRRLDDLLAAGAGRRTSPVEQDEELLTAYLRTGVLPWVAAADGAAAAATRLHAAAVRGPARIVAALRRLPWSERREALRRLLQLVEPGDWETVAAHVPAHAAAGAPLRAALQAIAARPAASLAERQQRAAVLLGVVDATDARRARTELAPLLDAAPDDADRSALRSALDDYLRTITAHRVPSAAPARRERRPAEATTIPAPSTDRLATTRPRRPPAQMEPAATAVDLPLLVPDAGLILLHPFLPRLFAASGLRTAADGSLEPAALPTAAALLSCLASGRGEYLDLELPFIKVLLGLRPETELPAAGRRLESSDVAEVEALLSAALDHWSALKHTSAAGLRTAFLQRPGLLDEDAQGWRLRVEPRGYDALLDHLPWGFRLAVLPWLRRPIVTEWHTP